MSTDEPDAEDLAEAFPHVAQLEQELKEADASVEELAEQSGTTRRDLLAGSAGLLGLGGILTAGSGTAQAGDDQVGSLGTDGNRLDAEIEDLDLTDQSSTPAGPGSGQVRFYAKNGSLYYKPAGGSETQVGGGAGIFEDTDSDGIYEQTTGSGIEVPSVNTGETRSNINDGAYQSAADGLLVPVGDGLGIGDAIDPANSSNALADMMDLFAAESTQGKILLPGSFNVSGQVDMTDGVGFEGVSSRGSIITQTDPSADLLAFGARGDVREASFSNFALEGPGDGAATGSPIVFSNAGGANGGVSLNFDGWKITKWANAAIRSDGAQPFEIDWGRGRIGQVDAGNVNALIDPSGGAETPGWTFQNLAAYPTRTASGNNSRLYQTENLTQGASFQFINIGGSMGNIYNNGNRGFFRAGHINYVPTDQASVPANLFKFNRDGPSSVGSVVVSGSCDYVYRLNANTGNKHMGSVEDKGSNISTNVVEIAADPVAPSVYEGTSAEVDDNAPTDPLTHPVSCLGDLTLVT